MAKKKLVKKDDQAASGNLKGAKEPPKQTAGGIGGAVLGSMVAGPVGAVIGGIAGALVGKASAEGKQPIKKAAVAVEKTLRSSGTGGRKKAKGPKKAAAPKKKSASVTKKSQSSGKKAAKKKASKKATKKKGAKKKSRNPQCTRCLIGEEISQRTARPQRGEA